MFCVGEDLRCGMYERPYHLRQVCCCSFWYCIILRFQINCFNCYQKLKFCMNNIYVGFSKRLLLFIKLFCRFYIFSVQIKSSRLTTADSLRLCSCAGRTGILTERSALAPNVGLVVDLFWVSRPRWMEAHRTTPFGVTLMGCSAWTALL